MKKPALLLMAILAFWIAVSPLDPVSGARGVPGTPDFGYGGHLPAECSSLDTVHLAANLNLDWVALPIAWQAVMPQPDVQIAWSQLDPIFNAVARARISVMLSLTQPPAWAVTSAGPDPKQTALFLNQLLQRYPAFIQAVELFPAANTRVGWGAAPDAKAYLNLFKVVQSKLNEVGLKPILVAGGLIPLSPQEPAQDVDDLVFLQKLYAAGGAAAFQVLSVDLGQITGKPLQSPAGGEHRVLRHYEEIRQVMIKNNHLSGMIWITHLSVPSGKINPGEVIIDPYLQDAWLAQAYGQIRSQLYIGATFYDGLNLKEDNNSLILSDGSYHPFYRTLRGLIVQSISSAPAAKPGQAKEQPLLKKP